MNQFMQSSKFKVLNPRHRMDLTSVHNLKELQVKKKKIKMNWVRLYLGEIPVYIVLKKKVASL